MNTVNEALADVQTGLATRGTRRRDDLGQSSALHSAIKRKERSLTAFTEVAALLSFSNLVHATLTELALFLRN